MHITLLAIGSRGDVQPLAALGVGLQRRGHTVHLAAGDEFAGLVGAAGLEFVPLGVKLQAEMAQYSDIFKFMHSLKPRVVQAASREADAIVATFLGVSALPLARQRGIPYFYAAPIPGLETGAFPAPLFPALPLGRGYNRLTYRLSDGLARRAYPDAQSLFQEPHPAYLFCYSAHVLPQPADWGPYAHVTGYWFLEQAAGWQPPAGLEDFLQAGPPPVYVGFGSAVTREAARLTEVVLAALRRAGQRGVLVTGWGGLQAGAEAPEVYVAEALPFDWLFPRLAAAVHHGGAGTTAAALRAGLPAVVIPFGADQGFWARQVQRLGVGIGPLAPKGLTAERLAEALRRAVTDQGMQAQAQRLGAQIRAEDGVGTAIQIIEAAQARPAKA